MKREIPSRREAFASALSLPLAARLLAGMGLAAASVAAHAEEGGRTDAASGAASPTVLVALFTRTGNTAVVARHIRRVTAADLFEIVPATAYPEDYEETVAQASREREAGYEPLLTASVPAIDRYETVVLAFPIWGMSVPPPVRTFLRDHDLSGKTLVPAITHGGYGLGDSIEVIRAHAPRARVVEGFTLEADQERRTLASLNTWLAGGSLGDHQDRVPSMRRSPVAE